MESVRVLRRGDEEVLARFLESRPDTTMFLRANLRGAGLLDRGERPQGTWAAAFDGGEVVAAASHFWNGNVIVEAPIRLDEVVRACVEASPRGVKGVIGVEAQAREARRVMGLEDAEMFLDSREDLFVLRLEDLRVPDALTTGRHICRLARSDDEAVLAPWAAAYHLEALGVEDTQEMRDRSVDNIRRGTKSGRIWVLEDGGRLVSMTMFNAVLPDCVQVGGVWTPPELRSNGYARSAVAGSLIDAREEGVERSILFTPEDNHAAQACYLGLGYEIVGDYCLLLFAAEHDVVA